MTRAAPRILALVGAIGAGKSAVAKWFAGRGATVVDADAIGHEILLEPEVVRELAAAFGPAAVTPAGEVDRRRLGRVVFADPGARVRLEAIVHPRIRARVEKLVAAAKADPVVPLVVVDAAILLEVGWQELADFTLFVDAPRETRLRRVAARGWTEQDLARREAAQWPLERKRAAADVAIVNDDGALPHLELDAIWRRLAAPTTEAVGGPALSATS
jgi:dephospho-CoA kinase